MNTIEHLYNIYISHRQISTDTRHITPGSLFFALHGRSFDGNDYATRALECGAAHCVVDRKDVIANSPEWSEHMTLVDDTLTTLQQLATYHRNKLGIKVLAISGSNGKTTTKELLSAVLSTKYKLCATRGNLNNHIGVPLTLLAIEDDRELAVVEMGASSCNEIALLCSIARPNFGILTNVGRAHLEGFGGEEGVIRGKGELFDYLAANDGVAFVASDNATILAMSQQRKGVRRVLYSYSLADGVEHNLEGEYNRFNVAAAIAVGEEFLISRDDIISAIKRYSPNNNRSQRVVTERNTLIVDCYNANPSSMEASIKNFSSTSFADTRGKIMILGDMFELGEWSESEHRRVVELATQSDAQRVYLVGENFSKIASTESRILHFESREMLERELREREISECAVLIKGSRGVGLENIISLM